MRVAILLLVCLALASAANLDILRRVRRNDPPAQAPSAAPKQEKDAKPEPKQQEGSAAGPKPQLTNEQLATCASDGVAAWKAKNAAAPAAAGGKGQKPAQAGKKLSATEDQDAENPAASDDDDGDADDAFLQLLEGDKVLIGAVAAQLKDGGFEELCKKPAQKPQKPQGPNKQQAPAQAAKPQAPNPAKKDAAAFVEVAGTPADAPAAAPSDAVKVAVGEACKWFKNNGIKGCDAALVARPKDPWGVAAAPNAAPAQAAKDAPAQAAKDAPKDKQTPKK